MMGSIAGPFRFSAGQTWLVAESIIELALKWFFLVTRWETSMAREMRKLKIVCCNSGMKGRRGKRKGVDRTMTSSMSLKESLNV
jgi:hypothetical protein